MQLIDGRTIYSATDLNNFLECRRLPELELLVALGTLRRPRAEDEQADLVRKKGDEHETRYLERLRRSFEGGVVEIPRPDRSIESYEAAQALTIAAMERGARIIYQATFFDGEFLGHADFLERIDGIPSQLGNYIYEASDTKLALSTKPYFIIQLCNYSEHLQRLQGVMPKQGRIVFGDGRKLAFNLNEYLAYYRRTKQRYLEEMTRQRAAGITEPTAYPLQTEHCLVCPWDEECESKRRTDDHLSLVASMRRDQIVRLETNGITTLAALAAATADARPRDMIESTWEKIRKQAQLQMQSRLGGAPVHELLAHDPRAGFGLLPEPDEGDVYFDMEGDPMYEPRRGLEYLFGAYGHDNDEYVAFWGTDRAQEKRAFEQFVDFIVERRKRYPRMHVYHYANYEKAALQRLSQQHSTRGREVDDLLRAQVLVDLYAVVRQSMMIGEESYSIKKLERFYGFHRETGVKRGDASIVEFEKWRVFGDQSILDDIEAYNKDDCESTWHLHRWLQARRDEAIVKYGDIPWRPLKKPEDLCHDEPFEGCATCRKREKHLREDARMSGLEKELLSGVVEPDDDDAFFDMAEPMRSRYLLGNALSYHRRERNPVWWEYFSRCENADELLEHDGAAIAGLELVENVAPVKKGRDRYLTFTYRFPPQRHKMEAGDDVYDPSDSFKKAGTIVAVDDDAGTLQLKRAGGVDEARALTAIVPGGPRDTDAQEASLATLAEAFRDDVLDKQFPAAAAILKASPAFRAGQSVSDTVRSLDNSYLFIQGPPGSGKSTVGAEVICDLLAAGKRVGVMSRGHKAMHHLLHKVEACMTARGKSFTGLYKHSDEDSRFDSKLAQPFIDSVSSNKYFDEGAYDLAGGTSWLFSREALRGKFDYLFIDEAGQIALADALAVAPCATNVVLLGDPSQLAHVGKGTHALRCNASVLEHLLGRDTTVPPHRGIFLDRSFRMHPDICALISAMVYDGRLQPGDDTWKHAVHAPGSALHGSGLRAFAIDHRGNSASSVEEADRIVAELLRLRGATITDDDGIARPFQDRDAIVVAPYNAQRRLISRKLKAANLNVLVGTVDKFQGQEAAIVFYSMAASSAGDAPRDLKFLLERNRFNVAISRARAVAVLVYSPALLEAHPRSAEQMALLNDICRYVERA